MQRVSVNGHAKVQGFSFRQQLHSEMIQKDTEHSNAIYDFFTSFIIVIKKKSWKTG